MILGSLYRPSTNMYCVHCTADTQVQGAQGVQGVGGIIVVVLETKVEKHAAECLL